MENFLKIEFDINPELDKIADTPLDSDKFKACQKAFIDAFLAIEKYLLLRKQEKINKTS